MFAISSIVPTRVPTRDRSRNPNRIQNTTTRAYVNWVMDGVGCQTARSGDQGSLLKSKSNIVSFTCPTKPLDLSALCTQSDGFFKIGNAAFEAKGDDIWVTNVQCDSSSAIKLNGKAVSYDQKIKLTPGAVLDIAGEEWQLNRNTHAHA
ncbi:hypothetical protein OAD67_01325 [bacterium]|nr:hypothetical protein [bacterium]